METIGVIKKLPLESGIRYNIKEKIGAGGQANIFLVEKEYTNDKYVIKVLKEDDSVSFNREERYLTFLKNLNHPNNRYITNIINSEEGLIIRKDRPIEQKKYIILEHCEGGTLIDFVVGNNPGFGELYSKLIFIKIFNAVKLCHDKGICHRDIKPDNILLDEKYNPKLCDFGHATENKDNLKEFKNIGTAAYKAPEILKGRPYDGFKADIFSLGKSLVEVTHGKPIFKYADENDDFYNIIIKGNTELFKNIIKNLPGITPDFIDLYMKMISLDPEKRPSIDQILNHHWFNEIYEMEDKIKIDLEKKLESAFEQRVPEAKRQWKITIDQENYNSDIANSKSRSCSDKEQNYFIKQIEPKYIKGEINHFDYIKIKGFLQPNIFMYALCEELDKKFKDLCPIEPSEEKLKFIVYFIEKIETQNDNEKKETIERDLVSIQVKLYKTDDGYILKLIKKEGSRRDFFDKYKDIAEIVQKLFK
jgi:serine/threonine protein kinase